MLPFDFFDLKSPFVLLLVVTDDQLPDRHSTGDETWSNITACTSSTLQPIEKRFALMLQSKYKSEIFIT